MEDTRLVPRNNGCRLKEPRKGPVRTMVFARHLGAKVASGSSICFLSADDAYSPDFIASMLRYASCRCITFCDYFQCDSRLMAIKPNVLLKGFEFRGCWVAWLVSCG